MERATRRGNYESDPTTSSSTGELRFSFNEQEFGQRVEQAAVNLDSSRAGSRTRSSHDLLELAVNGEIREPKLAARRAHQRALDRAGRARQPQPRPLDPAPRLPRRLARPRVKEGELDVVFDGENHTFGYVQPDRDSEPIESTSRPGASVRVPPARASRAGSFESVCSMRSRSRSAASRGTRSGAAAQPAEVQLAGLAHPVCGSPGTRPRAAPDHAGRGSSGSSDDRRGSRSVAALGLTLARVPDDRVARSATPRRPRARPTRQG